MRWVALAWVLRLGVTDGVIAEGVRDVPAAVRAGPAAGALAPEVPWSSAPPVGRRARLSVPPGQVVAYAGDDPLVAITPGGAVIAAELEHPSNAALRRWPYLGFVLRAAERRAAGRPRERLIDWPGAPIVRRGLGAPLAAAIAGLGALLAAALLLARRRSRRDPDAAARLFARLEAPREAGWRRPGFDRPLAGLLFYLSATLIALGPWLFVSGVVIPSRVQPFPDADGWWAPLDEVAMLAWSVLELGLTTAFVQRFAQDRAEAPERALAAAQLWIWWQLFAGLAQLALGAAAAITLLPTTPYAAFSRLLLLRAAMQVPGVLGLFTIFFQAAQRFDLQLGLDLLEKRVLGLLVPIPCVLYLRGRFAGEEAYGAVLGLAAGQYLAQLGSFVAGAVLYRRLGLPFGPLLGASFDHALVRRQLRYGAAIVAGKAPFFLANALEVGLLTTLLPAYPTWIGIRGLLARLAMAFYLLLPFFDSGIAAFAESLGAGRRALARYQLVRYLQLGHLFAAVMAALLAVVGPTLVRVALPPDWAPVAAWLPLCAATGLLLPAAWLCDAFQKGAGRPGLNAALVAGEQALRVALFLWWVPRLGFAGVLAAVLASVAVKAALGAIANRRLLPGSRHPWRSTIAPLAAGALFALGLAVLVALVPARAFAIEALFIAAAALAFPAGLWLLGALGALDPAALDELDRAAALTSVMRPVARLLTGAARAGARLGPVRPLPLAAEAAREAT